MNSSATPTRAQETPAQALVERAHPSDAMGFVHALSFDIEDWFHIVEVRAVRDSGRWPALSDASSLVERYTDHILSLCDEAGVRATFFILGWIAERHPALVARIADAGHEIGTHSFWHRKVYELDKATFREDLMRSLDAIRTAAPSVEILGFRAPSFSITPGTEWAFDVLFDAGLRYDTSLFPGRRGHGGYACTPGAHRITTPLGQTLAELPMSLATIGVGPMRRRMCYSGGGYLRALPYRMIEQGLRAEAAQRRPTVVYLHPRDFAPDCPKVAMPPLRFFKCYIGTRTTTAKLRRLLAEHRWATCLEVLRNAGQPVKAGDPTAPLATRSDEAP